MKKSQYTAEQIAFALRQAESGTPVPGVCWKMEISQGTYHRWKKKYAGMCVAEVRKLRILLLENPQLEQLITGLSPHKHKLPNGHWKKPDARSTA